MVCLKNIEAFITIVQEGNFTKAGEKLFLSQSAISKQLKVLESSLNVVLIERNGKEFVLTDFGEVFYHYAVKILESYKRAQEDINEVQSLKKGTLSLGASTLPGEYILPKIMGNFKSLYPEIKANLYIGSTEKIIDMLNKEQVKLAFVGAKINDKRIETREFIKDELILIGPANKEYSQEKSIKDFLNVLIVRESGSGTRKVVNEYLKKQGIILNEINLELGSTRAIITAVQEGMGVSFISLWAVQEALQLGKVKEIKIAEGSIERYIYLAYLKDRYINNITQKFLEFI